jgi:methanogenic corrinoid protein MtbC1
MYSIKQASLRSGVSVPLLRQWERRYGVVRPARTDSGYRMYDDAAIERIRLMRELVDDGWAPSNAGRHVRELADAAVSDARHERMGPADMATPTVGEDVAAAFVDAAASLRDASIESVLDDMFARGSFEQVATRYLMPALRALGAAWSDGTIDVAAEHVASAAALRRLSGAYQAAARAGDDGSPVLVGLPPGARHELGALAFAIMARRAGLHVVYLGADLPVADWLRSVEQTGAAAAVLGVVAGTDVAPAKDVAAALSAAFPSLVVAYGGGGVGHLPHDAVGDRLPDDLGEAVAALGDLIAAHRSSGGGRSRRPKGAPSSPSA